MKIASEIKISERTIIQGLIILFSITIITISLLGDKGMVELHALTVKETKLKQDIRDLKLQQRIWIDKLESMKTNPTYIENIAREKLGMVRKNELVFLLEYK